MTVVFSLQFLRLQLKVSNFHRNCSKKLPAHMFLILVGVYHLGLHQSCGHKCHNVSIRLCQAEIWLNFSQFGTQNPESLPVSALEALIRNPLIHCFSFTV